MSAEQRILSADVFDTLEFSALVFGIGSGQWWDFDGDPCCIHGHGILAEHPTATTIFERSKISDGLRACGIGITESDRAVHAINRAKGLNQGTWRVTWPEYTAELNIVRGD